VTRRYRYSLAAAAAATVLAGGAAASPALAAGRPLPAHVFAPYYETYLAPKTLGITATSKASGVRYFTLAFLQTAKKGSCALDWNGSASQPLTYYTADVAALRHRGGEVIPSFGGYSADQGGTEIADSCHRVAKIAKAYEQVVTTYHVSRLDMDVEAKSLTNKAGIARRSAAIAMAQRWACRHGINLRIQFTIGIEPSGLDLHNLGVVRSAVAHRVKVSSVNLMVFDYYLAKEPKPLHMGRLAIEAVTKAHRQLMAVFPGLSPRRVWHLEGMTMLPGIDDYPKKTEVTYLHDAAAMMRFAKAHRMSFLSIWAVQRDNGRCPGKIDSNTCSGIRQRAWAFSHLLENFNR
jgi:hypothetical protein